MRKFLFTSILLSSHLLFGSNTYEIKEQDFISEIENKKPILEEKMKQYRAEQVEKMNNYSGESLPKATISQIRYIDPSYELQQDIPKYDMYGKKIGVLYQKGYKFNPIEFTNVIPPDFIVFNACDNLENKFVNELIKTYEQKNKDYMLVNSGCKNKDLKNTNFNSKVYFLTKEMIDKFKLEHTVSIITANKQVNMIVVKEVSIDEKTYQ